MDFQNSTQTRIPVRPVNLSFSSQYGSNFVKYQTKMNQYHERMDQIKGGVTRNLDQTLGQTAEFNNSYGAGLQNGTKESITRTLDQPTITQTSISQSNARPPRCSTRGSCHASGRSSNYLGSKRQSIESTGIRNGTNGSQGTTLRMISQRQSSMQRLLDKNQKIINQLHH
jgi:hypothetical protein